MRSIRGERRNAEIERDSVYELIGLVYQAASDVHYWPLFLEQLAELTDRSVAASWSREFHPAGDQPGLVLLQGGNSGSERFSELCALLSTHFQRAQALLQRTQELERRLSVLERAMSRVPFGIILVDRRLQVTQMNDAARRILDLQDGLILRDGRLFVQNADEFFSLKSAILAGPEGKRCDGVFWVSRSVGKRPLGIMIQRLCDRASGPQDAGASLGVLFLADPDSFGLPDPAVLRRVYGFTEAESRLALQLMQGKSVEESAAILGNSTNTVRTHLRRLLQKTETGRQADLVRLLLTGPASFQF